MKKILLLTFTLTLALMSSSQTVWDPIQNIDPATGPDAYVIASGDLDGDTDMDIAIGTFAFGNDIVRWYENDGAGNFTIKPNVSTVPLGGVGGIAIADLDGINGNDIITVSYLDNALIWYANDGLGGFSDEQNISTSVVGAGQVTVKDINNDGDDDVAVVAFDGDEAVWFAGNGDGTFGAKQVIASVTEPGIINFADFDGDGDLDVVLGFSQSPGNGVIEVYYNQYIENGTMTVSWIKDTNTVDSGNPFLFVAAFADVDDDGTLEIIKSDNTSGEVAYYDKIKNGDSTETIIQDDTIIDRPAVVAVADFDNDTYNDVLVTDGGSVDDALIWFESTDVGTLMPNALIANNNYQIFGATIADFDGDGDKDVASVGFFSETVDWYENKLETLSNQGFQSQEIGFYPNPTKDKLYFRSNNLETITISVFDVLGKKVLAKELAIDRSFNVSELKSGMYIIKFKGINASYKFVKN